MPYPFSRSWKQSSQWLRLHITTWTRSCGCFVVLQTVALGINSQTISKYCMKKATISLPVKNTPCICRLFRWQNIAPLQAHIIRHDQSQGKAGQTGKELGSFLQKTKLSCDTFDLTPEKILCLISKHVFKLQINSLMRSWQTDARNHSSYILQILYVLQSPEMCKLTGKWTFYNWY